MGFIEKLLHHRLDRRTLLTGALGTGVVLFRRGIGDLPTAGVSTVHSVSQIFDIPVQYVSSLTELGGRTIEEAIRACELRRRLGIPDMMLDYLSPLEEVLDTNLSQSTDIGLVNAHHWREDENRDWGGPFAFAVDPNAKPVGGKSIWFANTPSVAHFRPRSLVFGDPLVSMSDRAIWSMHKGNEGLAVIELEDEAGLRNLPNVATLLARAGVKTIVIGNEFDNDPGEIERRYVPQMIYTGGTIVRDTYASLGVKGVNIVLPACDFSPAGYGAKTRKQFDDVARCGDNFPFNTIAYHSYGGIDDFLDSVDDMREHTTDIPSMKHYLTEIGNPLARNLDDPARERERAVGSVAQSLALAIGSGFFSKVYYHALFDGSNEHLSLAHIIDGILVPLDSYLIYKIITKLFANPVEKPEIEVRSDIMIVRGKRRRNDEIEQEFAVAWSRGGNENLFVPVKELSSENSHVYSILGNPTGEQGMVQLDLPTNPLYAGESKILIA